MTRKIFETSSDDFSRIVRDDTIVHARVYRIAEYDEYVTRFYAYRADTLVHVESADYFTDDRSDAIETAKYTMRQCSAARDMYILTH